MDRGSVGGLGRTCPPDPEKWQSAVRAMQLQGTVGGCVGHKDGVGRGFGKSLTQMFKIALLPSVQNSSEMSL